MTAPLTVLQITDTHLLAPSAAGSPPRTLLGVDTAETLGAVLRQALGEGEPDALIASGDLAHEPGIETYRRFSQIVTEAFCGPVLHLPGNHDLGEPFLQVLGADDSLRLGDWEIIAFDTHVDHRTEAGFEPAQREALLQRIDIADAPHVLLVCHHHQRPIGCPWLDKDRVPEGAALLDALTSHPRVRGLVFGHVHQEVSLVVNGKPVAGTPSTCFQFQPRSERFAIDQSASGGQPGYRWLRLDAAGGIASRVARLVDPPIHIDLSDGS